MPLPQVHPNVITYSAAISSCEKGQQWAKALQLFSHIQQSHVHPFVVTYNSAISARGQGHQWAEPLQLFFRRSQSLCVT